MITSLVYFYAASVGMDVSGWLYVLPVVFDLALIGNMARD